jgi:propionyl-CoA synthetase
VAAEAAQLMRDPIGPVAPLKTALAVERLPKTRSDKILRQITRKIADSEANEMPVTTATPPYWTRSRRG